ncbi:VOC family protein [Sporolactobacillus terrae]|nr:VOC family protein [Sporolactobacillus terrae]UAK15437.1 VOC family protein [Sporolactobacillus terrae]
MDDKQMINHINVIVSDLKRSTDFYESVLTVLGYRKKLVSEQTVSFSDGLSSDPGGDLWLSVGKPVSGHFAFQADTHKEVHDFFERGINYGGKSNGAPGYRVHYHPQYYAAYLLDPDGYNIEAVCHK